MPRIIPSGLLRDTSFANDLKDLLALTPEQMRALSTLVESGPSVTPLEISEVDVKLINVLPITAFLYELARSENAASTAVVDEIHAVAGKLGLTLGEEQRVALVTIFEPKPSRDKNDAIRSSKGCVLPTLSAVSVTQELRSVPNIRSKESLGVIPVVTLGLQISYPSGDNRSIAIELDEETLRTLCESLDKASDELKRLKEQAGSSLKVL